MWLFLVLGCPGGGAGDDTATTPAADADHDGWTDDEERAAGSDPYDGRDTPYRGGWTKDACRSDMAATGSGTDVGEGTIDASFVDRYGDTVHLWDFCDRVVYLSFGSMRDERTRTSFDDLQDLVDDGLFAIGALAEDETGADPTAETLGAWGDAYHASFPVVADPDYAVMFQYADDQAGAGYAVIVDHGSIVAEGFLTPADAYAWQ